MEDCLHKAKVLARSLGDQHHLGRIAPFMVVQRNSSGEYEEALRVGQDLTIARTLGDRPIEVLATAYLGFTHLARGEFGDAATLLERNVTLEGDLRTELWGARHLSAARSDEAGSHAQEALAIARRLGARGSEAHALCLTGDVASTVDAGDAESYYRQALALAEPRGMRPLISHCHFGLGKLSRRMGNHRGLRNS